MSPTAGPTVFELTEDPRAEGAGLLGVWRESTVAGATSTDPGVAVLPLWRADLGPEPSGARARLTGSQAKLGASIQRLGEASSRLDATLERNGGAFAFAPGDSRQRGGPESQLDAWLLAAGAGGAGLAFAADGGPPERGGQGPSGPSEREVQGPAWWWESASRTVVKFSGRVARWCTPWSRVETLCGGRPTGLSLIGLGGDVHTVLGREIRADDAAVHERVVALAVTSRATLLRVLGIVGRGATSIGSRLALPGGPLLALPAVWRFVNEVINEAAPPARG